MEAFRKRTIATNLMELILENKEYSVAQLLMTVMRSKNMNSGTEPYFMTDEDFSSALENTIEELKETINE